MRSACSLIAAVLLSITSALSTTLPDFSFHWNQFSQVQSVNGFLIGISDYGLTVLSYVPKDDNYRQGETLLLREKPVKVKAYGDSLLVQTAINQIYVINFSGAPQLQLVSTITSPVEFYDFAVYQGSIYLACGYEGIQRVSAGLNSDGLVIDYSKKGVLVTQVDVLDNQLVALDEYNGLMSYDLGGAGFGTFNEYLYLDQRAYRFDQLSDSSLIIMNKTANALIVDKENGSLTIGGALSISQQPLRTFVTDNSILLISARSIDKYNKSDFNLTASATLNNLRVEGAMVNDGGKDALIFPNEDGGLARIDLANLSLSQEVLAGAGKIRAIVATSDDRMVASIGLSLKTYLVNDHERPVEGETLRPLLSPVWAMTAVGNTVIAIYPDEEELVTIHESGNPPTRYLERFDLLNAGSVRELKSVDTIHDFGRSLVMRGTNDVSLYHVEQGQPLKLLAQFQFPDNVNDVAIHDSLFAVAYGYTVELFAIDSTLALTHLATRVFDTPANRLELYDNRMITIDWNHLMLWDISQPTLPYRLTATEIESGLANIELVDNYLFAVGPGGAYAFDLSYDAISVDTIGSLPATMLTWIDATLFTSDGTAIHGYKTDLRIGPPGGLIPETYALYQNFPNPFNPTTSIQFDLPQASSVSLSVFNSLGQRVRSLLNRSMPAGRHTILWDGTNSSGEQVASGIYFYRLSIGERESTRKMVLLK